MATSHLTEEIGRVLSDRYRLLAPLGVGASAQVFLADDVRLRRRVAVKMLHPALADEPDFLRRFRSEAQAAAALNHPNIVAVYDWGGDDLPYIVAEYLGGGSLRAMLDAGTRLTVAQAARVGLEAARALQYAHARGLVHRDIKPANLLFGDDGRLRVADFGLARALAEAAWTEPQGAVLGTARYSSPEQALGERLDGRADVYALALVLVEAVTRSVPFSADTTIGTLMARVGKPLPVPPELGRLVEPLELAGAADPKYRLDADGLVTQLQRATRDLPPPAPLDLAGTPVSGLDVSLVNRDPTEHAPPATVVAEPGDAPPPVLPTGAEPPGRHRRRGGRRRWLLAALALVLLAALGFGGTYGFLALRTPTHAVPALAGLTEAQARARAAPMKWKLAVAHARQDGSTPGQVLRTDPATGKRLAEGKTLTLVVSDGNTLVGVPPDLAGKPQDQAAQALQQVGLQPQVQAENSETVPQGVVVSIGPNTPAQLPKGSPVALVVSSGPAPRTVPPVAGLTPDQVAAKLQDMGLKAATQEQFSDTAPQGGLIGTSPGAGASVPRGATVTVVVSKGPQLVAVPGVGGLKSVADAVAALQGAGFTPGAVSGPAAGSPKGFSPPSGTMLRKGTTVNVVLG